MHDSEVCLGLPLIEATPLKTQLRQRASELTHKEAWSMRLRKVNTNKNAGSVEFRVPVLPG